MNKFEKGREIMETLNSKNMRDVDIKFLEIEEKWGTILEKIEIRKEYELHHDILDGNYDTLTFLIRKEGRKTQVRLSVGVIEDENIDKIYNWVKEI